MLDQDVPNRRRRRAGDRGPTDEEPDPEDWEDLRREIKRARRETRTLLIRHAVGDAARPGEEE
jgi:hypothetical protein